MNEKNARERYAKYHEKYKSDKTQWFLDSIENPIIDKFFNPILSVLTKDRSLNLIYNLKDTPARKILRSFLEISSARIEKKAGISKELRLCLFGKEGSKGKRSALAFLLVPILKKYLSAWKSRQVNKIEVPRTIHIKGKLPEIWIGWKKLRDEVCPNFNLSFDPKKEKTIKILPDDILTPKERINRLVEFKDVDRIGIGFSITHATSFIGAQPSHNIGGLWQFAMGPGINMAKAALNTWIRLGGLDFLPSPMMPMVNPIPETHSPFYFDWKAPSDIIYEQFIEKELFKLYDQIFDWGLTSLAQEVSKAVVYRAILGLRETIKAFAGFGKYFDKAYQKLFESYALSIFALWDIIPMARGMVPFFKDLRKRPEEIIEVFEFLEPGLTELGLAIAKIAKAKYVLIGNSRGSNSWISPKMFEKIFWPTQKATCEKIIKAGYKLCAHLDNDWTDNMEYMLELPKHSGFFHLDQADLPKVREIIGDHFCLMGNLQPAITTGSGPDIVYKETKKLIETCGKEGGYIVATGCEAPATIPIENYYAVKRAIKDHGYFKH
ncbi:MAG: uroporphyrinogen decarboxylase family protein [Promethearchaeota archaeon]